MSEYLGMNFRSDILSGRAKYLCQIHPRGRDYVTQAPVLVCASLSYVPSDVVSVWRGVCERGAKLGDVMDAFHVNRGLRHLDAASLDVKSCLTVGRYLCPANPSALAQQVAARTHIQQFSWIRMVRDLANMGQPTERVIWFAELVPFETSRDGDYALNFSITHLRDFLRSDRAVNWSPHWKWKDLEAGMKRWEDDFAKQKMIAEAKYNEPLTPHAYAPRSYLARGGNTFTLLNTQNELRAEGATMHHCVGGYAEQVRAGTSLIYACSFGRARTGTLEISPIEQFAIEDVDQNGLPVEAFRHVWKIVQFKAHHNGMPSTNAYDDASEFVTEGFPKKPDETNSEKRIRKAREMMALEEVVRSIGTNTLDRIFGNMGLR